MTERFPDDQDTAALYAEAFNNDGNPGAATKRVTAIRNRFCHGFPDTLG